MDDGIHQGFKHGPHAVLRKFNSANRLRGRSLVVFIYEPEGSSNLLVERPSDISCIHLIIGNRHSLKWSGKFRQTAKVCFDRKETENEEKEIQRGI